MSGTAVEARLRRLLLLVVAGVYVGTVIELLLTGHTAETLQWIPLVLCAVGLIVVGVVLVRPHRLTILALRIVMVVVGSGSLLGIVLHLSRNYEFQREIHTRSPFLEVLGDALSRGAPLLAPGLLALTAALAILATYYHPALGHRDAG